MGSNPAMDTVEQVEPTFMGFTQSELCQRMDDFLKREIERKRRETNE